MKHPFIIDSNDALVIVDGNNDFIDPKGALYVSGNDDENANEKIIVGIKKLFTKRFSIRITTEDDHPVDNHIEYPIFGRHCVHNTEGQKYYPELLDIYKQADVNLKKGQNKDIIAYSVATSIEFSKHIKMLREKNIRRIFVVGWAYTHCVGESAIAYATQGFDVFVVRDLTRSVTAPYGNAKTMDKKLKLYCVKIISSNRIL